MYRYFFLINPISGGGQGKVIYDFLPEIMASLDYGENDWKAEFTEIHGMHLQIKRALSSTEILVAVGGDGTVSAVLSTMLQGEYSKSVTIGLIPLGTGNDLARVLNLYKPYVDRGLLFLVRKLVLAGAKPFDIWKINGKFALANYFSAGIDARIAHDFNQDRASGAISSSSVIANKLHYVKRFFADRKYILKSGHVILTDKNNNKEKLDISRHRTIIVGNIPSFASGANPFYKSNMADGLLEVVDVPNMINFLMAIAVGNIPLFGIIYKKYLLKSKKVKKLEFFLDDNEFLQLDGEDLTGKIGGQISIEFATQVKMLSLDS